MDKEKQSSMPQPISIVVPLYNAVGNADVILMQLNALAEAEPDTYQVIAADDASPDGTGAWVKSEFPHIEVVQRQDNGGFGANVNTGAEKARNPLFATVNSDIEMIGNPFPALAAAVLEDEKILAAQPLVWHQGIGQVETLNRLYSHRGLAWHTELEEEQKWSMRLASIVKMEDEEEKAAALKEAAKGSEPIEATLCGAFFVCRWDRFAQLSGFSERFQPFYWEDVDLEYRGRRFGWHCATVPKAAVFHRHGETIIKQGLKRKMDSLRLNQLRFMIDHGDQLEGLRAPKFWWFLRGLRESRPGGNSVLRPAYFSAAFGEEDF